ncbi:hypothetical protein [Piscirickettsia litoralis]|uniref:hypothetical protein n=1 Tax=Piscirickettsia litoralis TaxID=1891921 RepID=UPI000B0ED927|nr:hypothetical protein [Piscirickettsia litoralis]
MKQPYDIEVVSWSRAQHYVKSGYADGFFAASHNNARDKYATLTYRFVDQYWSWFTLKSKNISKKDLESKKFKVSSWEKSNSQRWLENNGYKTTYHPPERVDYLVSDLRTEKGRCYFWAVILLLGNH